MIMTTPQETHPIDSLIYNRNGTKAGKVRGYSRCMLEGCNGTRLHVRWPDKKVTKPCTRGLVVRNGHWRIG